MCVIIVYSVCTASVHVSGHVPCSKDNSVLVDLFFMRYLLPLPQQAKLIIHVAYGSQRHLAGFMELGLQSDQIYIHGNRRASKNPSVSNCQVSVCVGYSIRFNRERVDW